MKQNLFWQFITVVLTIIVFGSCNKDDYTIEDQAVTGNFTYITTGFETVEVDPVTQQPLAVQVSLEGEGTVAELGFLTLLNTFRYDLITGVGINFEITYTGGSSADQFKATGSSVREPDGSFRITETFGEGTGKFKKIKGTGITLVTLSPDGLSGTGNANWTLSF